ncbi:hypothetical protein [Streptomyces inhibens]|uniref:hypothetical protein n=1 Tax=Streptomyces inhibens TaxID=2293571 RepID=UPI0015F26D41|nr:hypothetical protein [Streptomyces inhibens]
MRSAQHLLAHRRPAVVALLPPPRALRELARAAEAFGTSPGPYRDIFAEIPLELVNLIP